MGGPLPWLVNRGRPMRGTMKREKAKGAASAAPTEAELETLRQEQAAAAAGGGEGEGAKAEGQELPVAEKPPEDADELDADEVEPAEVAAIENAAATFRFDPHFATGDCRDAMLGVLRSAVDFGKIREGRQRQIVQAVSEAARQIVQRLAEGISAEGRPVVHATLEQVTIKDGCKLVLKAPMDGDTIVLLAMQQGHAVQLMLPQMQSLDHVRAPGRVDPDQLDIEQAIPKGPAGDHDLVDAADPVIQRSEGITSMDIGVRADVQEQDPGDGNDPAPAEAEPGGGELADAGD
jgi:hypothetical protein